jgi:hypothetical protein
MKTMSFVTSLAVAAGLALGSSALAQAPAGSTGECKDGTYTQAESKKGACRGHKGVKEWYAESKSESKSEKSSKTKEKESSKAAAAPAAAPAPAPAPKATTTASTKKGSEGMRTEAAPGGGAGKVWVNTSSKVYHCSGDEWYGKTKEGEYMTEAQAKASGARAARNKTCS